MKHSFIYWRGFWWLEVWKYDVQKECVMTWENVYGRAKLKQIRYNIAFYIWSQLEKIYKEWKTVWWNVGSDYDWVIELWLKW